MKTVIWLCIALTVLLMGCARTQPPSSNTPAWDEHIPPDDGNTDAPSLFDKFKDSLGEDGDFHFRKVRWGFNRERVELTEAGNRVHERRDNSVVYKQMIDNVYCDVIYSFTQDKRLRTAGYLINRPINVGDTLIKEAVDKHGMPTHVREDPTTGKDKIEMVWALPETYIYVNMYPSIRKLTNPRYKHTPDGGLLLGKILGPYLNKRDTEGVIEYYDGSFAYVDKTFYNQLQEEETAYKAYAEMSFYEKRLLGVIDRAGRTVIPGLGTIPQ